MNYIQVTESTELPDISALQPFKAIVIVENTVSPDRQVTISQWLVNSGCLYMMAWGEGCRSWEETVDQANVDAFEQGEIPDASVVITTWHEDELLQDVFWYSKHTAMHPCCDLDNIVLLHLAPKAREQELTDLFENA